MKVKQTALALTLSLAIGVASGTASAAFLLLLERATGVREHHEFIVYALPFAGLALGHALARWGAPIAGGSNLVLDTVHHAHELPRLPLRMAPMVLAATVLTHLFGGSAGREGTAVQMGASLADAIAHRVDRRAQPALRSALVVAGIAGGFGSVFGTPLAGALFSIEVLVVGRLELRALAPALIASFTGDFVTRRLGVTHTPYPSVPYVPLTPVVVAELVFIGVAMGLVSAFFIELTQALKRLFSTHIRRLEVRMFVGGCLLVSIWRLCGSADYLGLGIPMIQRAFEDPQVPTYAFAAKILFTSLTLSSGFVGGEVTPLFFVGATLGSVLAHALGLPLGLGAAVGLAAAFGAAANTPLALSVMVAELCGLRVLPHALLVSVVAFFLSGHRGLYPSQHIHRTKRGRRLDRRVALRDYREMKLPK